MSTATFAKHDADLSSGEVVLEALRTRTEQLWDAEHAVLDGLPDAVTDMRVITRQLRSTLSGFSRVLDPEATRSAVAELAWLGRQLGEENDTHAMIKELHRLLSALPRESSVCHVAADVERELGQRSVQGTHVTQAALASRRYAALREALNQLLADPPFTARAAKPAVKELPRSVAKAMHKLDRRMAVAEALPPGPDRDEALHEARKADKLLRYVTEIAAPVIGKPARQLSRQAKKLQDLLGDYQDAVVTLPVLHKLDAASAAGGHPVAIYSVLDTLEQARIDRVVNKLPRRLGSLHDKGVWLSRSRRPHDRAPSA
ncbi:CHAD domain-containing protein [Pseudonocardia sp. DSM 110487]|uniref:CHAD domain-containing protein n=1 Tax=Pseudonocardia sp. DSM 110487 TaxID=2865833 RepID=UPI001C6A69F6|nr:CHAD domain-containing protein [Pseudonocardia sp. DSM 110487]QYN33783.1 CHAD domain-containing protein [Pseudonocardia sp. DSM 110487]